MSMNRFQFQPGMLMPEFLKQFGTEAQCEADTGSHAVWQRSPIVSTDVFNTIRFRGGFL